MTHVLPEPAAAQLTELAQIDWAQRPHWSTLSLGVGLLNFLQRWQRWRTDPQAPRILHEVVLCAQAPDTDVVLSCTASDDALEKLAQLLTPHCFGLIEGFHRILLDQGQVQLTLCIGQPIQRLSELQFEADAMDLGESGHLLQHADLPRLLARLSRRGTVLIAPKPGLSWVPEQAKAWASKGFLLLPATPDGVATNPAPRGLFARYEPAWTIEKTRTPRPQRSQKPGHCTVVGAGLAGAAVATALARRGWTVTVLEAADKVAAGASGAPLGLLAAHLSADDCPLSQISRAGVRLTLSEAQRLLTSGQEWAQTGILEHYLDKEPTLPQQWLQQGQDWCQIDPAAPDSDKANSKFPGVLHKPAGWLKPAALVRAWLAQPGIRLRCAATVETLRLTEGQWQALDAQGQELSRSDLVVLASACAVPALLQDGLLQGLPASGAGRLHTTRGMRGLISSSRQKETGVLTWPAQPIKGHGFAAGNIASADGRRWFVGASYQDAAQTERTDLENHQRNLKKLRVLDPECAQAFAKALRRGTVDGWKGVRCTTQNHLPIVGPAHPKHHPGLWVCFGLGSRGISLSLLCAEVLASRLGAEPLPLPVKLAMKLDPGNS